ncbi:hypothetical protein JANAI62_09950 [Jannaschia pagri]|uniref:YMGG-like Gly-zipper domain-containing protein n=1 Tax=Jannaschia pagri TaxID=2829797 RepID=A0ABQ4NIY0_9RHOB|nr:MULTISPECIES: hypothetical protein [unclassified Jannaschia]GIT90540.1 hypothetical protein JANAI61_09980 [Jannaschia sp. AI_61]GIT94372.1 hypothetical protein JANAI62_09950 [Jannaschia sp. AI_62]
MHRTLALPALALVTLLAACNTGSDLERAAIGGVIGCAVGEIIDDGKCVAGGAIGAAGGALANDF